MRDAITAEQMLNAFKEDVSDHPPGMGWAHPHGLGVLGTFGANEADRSWFNVATSRGDVRIGGFPRFVRTRGGACTFLPSISALRWIGSR